MEAMQREQIEKDRSYTAFLPEDILAEREAHIKYLEGLKNEGKLICAGPTTDYAWALLVYKCDSDREARNLIENDPFYRCGFFVDYEIYGWFYRQGVIPFSCLG